ncbi:hypothetical protein RB614_33120 [Phytohabitans sp. ZYX-F-186]|uniref:WXG100 family type VII secretion target n=1 Tax=Phytohabitans maris TaxID=3071409 RepID=A0ABU0ZQS5_9ACTN|nr:hypothetical protein [Phytohabitans sp. ZYX-F-186]MDQ7909375.1 hypothetical protein [Phytohabitans sp. ZYX-F-186]
MSTKLDPEVATKVAGLHRSTGGDIDLEIGKFRDTVDFMDGYCQGAMMTALLNAQAAWEQEARNIIGHLNVMAGDVESAVGAIDTQDVDNAQGVGSVGVSILRDI